MNHGIRRADLGPIFNRHHQVLITQKLLMRRAHSTFSIAFCTRVSDGCVVKSPYADTLIFRFPWLGPMAGMCVGRRTEGTLSDCSVTWRIVFTKYIYFTDARIMNSSTSSYRSSVQMKQVWRIGLCFSQTLEKNRRKVAFMNTMDGKSRRFTSATVSPSFQIFILWFNPKTRSIEVS